MSFADFCARHNITKGEVPALLDYLILIRTRELRRLLPRALRKAMR